MPLSLTAHTSRRFRLLVFAGVSACILTLTGCSTPKIIEDTFATSSPVTQPAPMAAGGPGLQNALSYWGERYKSNPSDGEASYAYARALTASGQNAQAVAVLQRAVLANPYDMNLKGALGNSLAANGQYEEALNMFQQAHTPDKPSWRVLSAQGAVLDQMGRPQDARKYYQTALRLSPDEPSVLSNLALSYALTGDLPSAEKTLEKAAKQPTADARVRQNLALIVGLQGRYADSERIASRDLSAAEAQQNVQTVRGMLAQQNTWADIQSGPPATGFTPPYGGGPNVPFAASAPGYGYPAPPPAGPTFATSVGQQPAYGQNYYGASSPPAPYGYWPQPDPVPEKTDWQEEVRKKRALRND